MREMLAEHEKYQDWTVSSAAIAVVDVGDLLTQKTKLMGTRTYQEGNKLTDVKTAVMPAY